MAALEKKSKEDKEKLEMELFESRKRVLPDDIRGHISTLESEKRRLENELSYEEKTNKRIKGYVAGFEWNQDKPDEFEYRPVSEDDIREYAMTCRSLIEDAFAEQELPSDDVMDKMTELFAPYVMCRQEIANSFTENSVDNADFESVDSHVELLGKLTCSEAVVFDGSE